MPKNWRVEHDPFDRPLGCNGKYGTSGSKSHRYRGETACDACRASEAHYGREYRRGQGLHRVVHGCGTWQRAEQHRKAGEPVDFACRLARNQYKARLKAEQIDPITALHLEGDALARAIPERRRRRCNAAHKHTTGHCQHCGVHAVGKLKMSPPPERIAA